MGAVFIYTVGFLIGCRKVFSFPISVMTFAIGASYVVVSYWALGVGFSLPSIVAVLSIFVIVDFVLFVCYNIDNLKGLCNNSTNCDDEFWRIS